MSPVFHTLRFEARVDKSSSQTFTTTTDTMRIQQATMSPTLQTQAVASNTAALPEPTSTNPAEAAQTAMPVNTKLGFAMIPVAVAVSAIVVLIAFWLRGRQMRKAIRNRAPPPVPEKGYRTPGSSVHFSGSSKARIMDAYSTPMRDTKARSPPMHIIEACRTPLHTPQHSQPAVTNWIQSHERWASTESVPIVHRPQHSQSPATNRVQSHERWTSTDQTGWAPIDMTAAQFGSPLIVEPEESPIDGSSPFRLKRGNTIKRNTLGSAIANTWPIPPPRVRMNLSDPTGRIPFPRLDAEAYDPRPNTYIEVPRREVPRRIQWDEGRFELGPDPGPTLRSERDGDI